MLSARIADTCRVAITQQSISAKERCLFENGSKVSAVRQTKLEARHDPCDIYLEKSRSIIETYGERDGIRTHDPLIKSQMLYQLSYALPEGCL